MYACKNHIKCRVFPGILAISLRFVAFCVVQKATNTIIMAASLIHFFSAYRASNFTISTMKQNMTTKHNKMCLNNFFALKLCGKCFIECIFRVISVVKPMAARLSILKLSIFSKIPAKSLYYAFFLRCKTRKPLFLASYSGWDS